jgi:PAS domain-containing protein
MSGDAPPGRRDDAQELQDLRQFFYQCPVGLFEIDDDGLVYKVNPAAVAMLAPAIGSGDLAKLFPILDQLAPQMISVISQDRAHMGPLAAGERILIPAEAHGVSSLEIRAVRVAAGRVMVVLLDVSAERRLAAEGDRLFVRKRRLMRRPLRPGTGPKQSPSGSGRPGTGCRRCRRSRLA